MFQPLKTMLYEDFSYEDVSSQHKESSITDYELGRSFGRMREIIRNLKFLPEDLYSVTPETKPDPFRTPPHKIRKLSKREDLRAQSPAKSDNSSVSNSSSKSSKVSHYRCPMPSCDFSLDKKQMRENQDGIHMARYHKVTQKMYLRDKSAYNFKKFKME